MKKTSDNQNQAKNQEQQEQIHSTEETKQQPEDDNIYAAQDTQIIEEEGDESKTVKYFQSDSNPTLTFNDIEFLRTKQYKEMEENIFKPDDDISKKFLSYHDIILIIYNENNMIKSYNPKQSYLQIILWTLEKQYSLKPNVDYKLFYNKLTKLDEIPNEYPYVISLTIGLLKSQINLKPMQKLKWASKYKNLEIKLKFNIFFLKVAPSIQFANYSTEEVKSNNSQQNQEFIYEISNKKYRILHKFFDKSDTFDDNEMKGSYGDELGLIQDLLDGKIYIYKTLCIPRKEDYLKLQKFKENNYENIEILEKSENIEGRSYVIREVLFSYKLQQLIQNKKISSKSMSYNVHYDPLVVKALFAKMDNHIYNNKSDNIEDQLQSQLKKETQFTIEVDFVNVKEYFVKENIIQEKNNNTTESKTFYEMCIVMDYKGGRNFKKTNLFLYFCDQYNRKNYKQKVYLKKKSEKRVFCMAVQNAIMDGIDQMHELGFCHRDIKLENVFFEKRNDKFKLSIGDFGLNGILGKISSLIRDKLNPAFIKDYNELCIRTGQKITIKAIDMFQLANMYKMMAKGYNIKEPKNMIEQQLINYLQTEKISPEVTISDWKKACREWLLMCKLFVEKLN